MGSVTRVLNELAWVPKPFLDAEEFAVAKALVNDPELQSHIPVRVVSLDNIETTQWALDQKKVDALEKQGKFDGTLGFVRSSSAGHNHETNGSDLDETVLIFDGHHRFYAAKQAGKSVLHIRVLNLPENEPLDLDGWVAQIKQSKKAILSAMDSTDRAHLEDDIYESCSPAGKILVKIREFFKL